MKAALMLACACVLALMPGSAAAHLLVTEVGYDPVIETGATAEFVEILNPGPAPVNLADVWLANDEEAYPLLVNGPITAGITSGDFVYRFPAVVLDPGRIAVVCHDSDAFLAEHFAGAPLSAFTAQPGAPLLFEITDDGEGDGVPAMLDWGSNPARTLSLANNGECVGLATWDGSSDRVQDLDWVCWLTDTYIPNKDVDFPFGIDGPDPDYDGSFFLEDLDTGVPAPDAPEGQSIHRTRGDEPGEVVVGGNGVGGHDETSEDWSGWVIGAPTPGTAAPAAVGVAAPPPVSALRLAGARPNPCRGATRIRFALPAAAEIALDIYDAGGRRIARLARGPFAAGEHAVSWNGRTAADAPAGAGLYFITLESNGLRRAASFVLLH